MNETTATKGKKSTKTGPMDAEALVASQKPAEFVKKVPRVDKAIEKLFAQQKGGIYRVIHGGLAVPRPHADWHYPDGTVNPNELAQTRAIPGDELRFDHLDAARLLDLGVIEPLDAKPSKLDKRVFPDGIWNRPKGDKMELNNLPANEDADDA